MLTLQDILRAGTVKRWHLVNTTRVQNLAEHQFGVAVLASELAERMGYSDQDVANITAAALLHDADEARTGDIPTPTKKRIKAEFGNDAFDVALGEFALPHTKELPEEVANLIKCADYLESMLFLSEHKVGRHADVVMEDIMEDAHQFFNRAGEPGRHAVKLFSELQNASYEI